MSLRATRPENDTPTLVAWSSLKNYFVTFDSATPSGTWYFTRNPAAQTTVLSPAEYATNIFRMYPDSEQVEPLLLTFGKAAQKMSLLEQAALTCPLRDEERREYLQFDVSYQAPDQPSSYRDESERICGIGACTTRLGIGGQAMNWRSYSVLLEKSRMMDRQSRYI